MPALPWLVIGLTQVVAHLISGLGFMLGGIL
jgi:hypothetical protein